MKKLSNKTIKPVQASIPAAQESVSIQPLYIYNMPLYLIPISFIINSFIEFLKTQMNFNSHKSGLGTKFANKLGSTHLHVSVFCRLLR